MSTALRQLESQSLKDVSIEGIAREAGVSKVTIYRWWDSKAMLVIDAFMEAHLIRTPMDPKIEPGQRIANHFAMLVVQYAGWPGRIVSQIIAEGQFDIQMLREFRERFHYGRRAVVREAIEDWRSSGGIPATSNAEALMDLLYAPVYMRLLVGHAPLDKSFIEQHLTHVFALLGAPAPDFNSIGVLAKSEAS